ncbi:MAG TPA: type 1 glutamine amidotransferase [Gaiellaceae bacterium]
MRILSLTHSPLARAELFGDVVRDEGHELVEWEIVSQGRPSANRFDAVLVFGGDMNVGEELEHPWLHDEYELLREWVASGTPLLGVCLGAQTLAHALGGRVARAPEPLVGFYETELADAGAADPVLGALPRRFEAFNANAYTFEVPDGATELARAAVPQAFRAGSHAWGVQFHPEVRREQVLRWWQDEELPRPLEELVDELDAKIGGWQELGRRLCRAFLAAAR